jgi:23S rRNA (adenine2503-C2)-methyltransferase
MTKKINLKALSENDLFKFVGDLGLPRYRANQLLQWIYRKQVPAIHDITEFSHELRHKLSERSYVSSLNLKKSLTSSDGTEKYLFSLEDDHTIESVIIRDKDRLTLCISSQVGCALGCLFCHTGKLGLIRNLKAHEIVDQILTVQRIMKPGKRITHIVFMGMGEPLLNLREVIQALWKIVSLIGISKRRITVSTAGIAPKLALLSRSAPGINLAVSLNATTDASRSRIMPVNKQFPLSSLMSACKKFPLPPRRRITFEYVLIDGINNSVKDAERLSKLLKGIRCKVNLIPLNTVEEDGMKPPPEAHILTFQEILMRNNVTGLIRKSKGQDIQAACGQLKGQVLSE